MITKNANARFSTVPREIADVGRTGGACVIHGVGACEPQKCPNQGNSAFHPFGSIDE